MAAPDRLDLKILNILQEEGRITILQLADRVGLSPTPCARRVKHLEDEGYIEKYVTLLNPRKLNAGLDVFVSVRLRSQTRDDFEKFEKDIKDMPEIVGCYLLTGAFDYLLHIKVADVETYRDFIRGRLTTIEAVTETQSSIVLQQLKHTTAIPLPVA